MNKHTYKYGRCHLYALAVNEVFGFKIKALWDLEPEDDLPTSLVHMWNVKDGKAFDIEGFFDESGVEDDYEVNDPDYASHTKTSVLKLIKEGVLDGPEPGEMEMLKKYVRKSVKESKAQLLLQTMP